MWEHLAHAASVRNGWEADIRRNACYLEQMRPQASGAIASANVVICTVLGILMFGPAAFGGFNATALTAYAILAVSMGVLPN